MKNRYLSQLVFSLLVSVISVVLTILYYVESSNVAFGISLSCTIFNIFRAGYFWNDYRAMEVLLSTMKTYINDLQSLINTENKE